MKSPAPEQQEKDSFSVNDVKVTEQKAVYKGFFSMVKYTLKHKLFAGNWSQSITREIFERGHAAALIPYDPINDSVVLIEQFRIGALVGGCSPWQYEIVAGVIDKNESAKDVVLRECQEEAGISVDNVTHITKYLTSAGGSSETINVFVGRVDSSRANGIHGLDEEGEDIRVLVLSREEAYGWVQSGKIENSAAIIAIQWLQIHYKKLQQNWT